MRYKSYFNWIAVISLANENWSKKRQWPSALKHWTFPVRRGLIYRFLTAAKSIVLNLKNYTFLSAENNEELLRKVYVVFAVGFTNHFDDLWKWWVVLFVKYRWMKTIDVADFQNIIVEYLGNLACLWSLLSYKITWCSFKCVYISIILFIKRKLYLLKF